VTIRDVLEEAAAEIDGVDEVELEDGVEWRVGGRPFALANDVAAEFGLDELVARAAMRTPDVTASVRGPGWVRFSPHTMDDPAVDRAEAWLTSAWRLAGR
jgi:hypothetical protein